MDRKLVCSSVPAYGETEAFVTHEGMYGGDHGHEEAEPEHGHGPHAAQPLHEDDDPPHEGEGGHDHETSGHTYHVSSITQCVNIGPVAKGSEFLLNSYYNMTEHKHQKGHDGKDEPIMAIEFLHFARSREDALKDILAQGQPNLQAFTDTVRSLDKELD